MTRLLPCLLAGLVVAPLGCARDTGADDDSDPGLTTAPKIIESEIEILDTAPPPTEASLAAEPDDAGEPIAGVGDPGDVDILNGDVLRGETSGLPLRGDAERGYEVPGDGAAYSAQLAPDPIESAEIEAHRVDAEDTGSGPVERLQQAEQRVERLQVERTIDPETRARIRRLRDVAERSIDRAEEAIGDLERRTRTATAPDDEAAE